MREFTEDASGSRIPVVWTGEGVEEKGIHGEDGRVLVEVDPRYFRPAEVDTLLGDPSKAARHPRMEAKDIRLRILFRKWSVPTWSISEGICSPQTLGRIRNLPGHRRPMLNKDGERT